MIDNYDSFTYNLVQYLGELGEDVMVRRNDQIEVDEIRQLAPQHLVISPGPCTPNEAGISMDVIDTFKGEILHNSKLKSPDPDIYHHDSDVFQHLESPFVATRYHSLVIEQESLPECLEVTAWTLNENGDMDEIMGVRHRDYPVYGVQFHPESILTTYGHDLLKNFLALH